jgi:hypothetical protein
MARKRVNPNQLPLEMRPRFVRWKRYGFTHVVDESKQQMTVCGNWWHGFIFDDPYFFKLHGKGRLPPSITNDDKRPMCGNCKKWLEKKGL